MADIKDFQCTYANSAGISEEVTSKLNLTFPDAYLHWDTMAAISLALKETDGAGFCELPFCHTVEAEAMGGIVNFGNEKIGDQLLAYIKEAQKYGVNMISYADSSGAVSIIGPAMAEQVVESFTYEFIKKAEALIGEDAVLLLCPRTALALIGTDNAEFADVALPEPMRYGEACTWMIGKEKIISALFQNPFTGTYQIG